MAIGIHVPHPRLPFWNPLSADVAAVGVYGGHGGL